MTIEYVPERLDRLDPRYVKNREADISCNECGDLGTFLVANAIELGQKHFHDHPDHKIKVIEVTCF